MDRNLKKAKRSKGIPSPSEAYCRYLAGIVKELIANNGKIDPQQIVQPSEEVEQYLIDMFRANIIASEREGYSILPRKYPPYPYPLNLLGKGILSEKIEEAARLAGMTCLSIVRSRTSIEPPFYFTMPEKPKDRSKPKQTALPRALRWNVSPDQS